MTNSRQWGICVPLLALQICLRCYLRSTTRLLFLARLDPFTCGADYYSIMPSSELLPDSDDHVNNATVSITAGPLGFTAGKAVRGCSGLNSPYGLCW